MLDRRAFSGSFGVDLRPAKEVRICLPAQDSSES